jgi:flagellar M-ring protein FliF
MIGGAVAVTIAFVVMLMQVASAPSYTTLLAGVNPAQTSKITSTLAAGGISFELQNNGTAVAVNSSQTSQARVALANAGLLSGTTQPGFSLLNSSQLGQSSFQQQITYERALEGQLAQTIDTINGISSAQVNLVLPDSQDQLFGDSQPATASVLLSDSGQLDSGAVRGIAELVASSVPSLSLDKVTITDANGNLLWPNGSSSSDNSGGLPAAQSADQRYDATMAAGVNTMLSQTLGAGKAQVTINASLNNNQATSDTLTYGKKGVPLSSQVGNETLKGGTPTGGAAGTTSNIPAYTTTGSSSSSYANKTNSTTWGVDKTITHAVIAPGAINQQSVSVLVSSTVPATDLPAIKAAVANAVGLQTKRGDTISIGQLAFAKPTTTTPTASTPASYIKYGKYGAVGLGSLIFLIFAGRMLKRRERENFAGQPTWLRELEAPRSLASLERGADTEVMALRPPVNIARLQVEDLVARDPDRVAQQMRAWMAEE